MSEMHQYDQFFVRIKWKVVYLVSQAGILFFVFYLYLKIIPSLLLYYAQSAGLGIAIRAKVEQKVIRMIMNN